jgi:polyisoprenoid-binding protein YceI
LHYKSWVVLLASLTLLTAPAFGQWVLKVEPNHSTVGFSVPIMGGITKVTGKVIGMEVEVHYDEEDITKSSVNVALKADSIDTGIDDRDKDLQSTKFFDVANHPEITFQSSQVEKRDEGFVAHGELTMRGVTRPIEIPFVFSQVTKNQKGRLRMGVVASVTLNRQDYGVGSDWVHSAVPNFIGDEVTVEMFFYVRGKKAEAR